MANITLVTGTDTGIGKTHVLCMLVSRYLQQSISTVALKPIETGCALTPNGLFAEDADRLYSALEQRVPKDVINPLRFRDPIAPWMAHQPEAFLIPGEPLPEGPDVQRMIDHIREVSSSYQQTFLEGAGGLMVPIAKEFNFADLAEELEAKVLVVVGSKLGCLNHAVLTFEAIRARKLVPVGYILNEFMPTSDWAIRTNRSALAALAERYEISEVGYIRYGATEYPDDAPLPV